MIRKLAIAIPTYNGGATIRQNLQQILKILPENVELIVSDNCSTDNTEDICKDVLNKYLLTGKAHYYRNEDNKGYDANVNLCVERADAEYVWLFSDNEIITDKDAFRKILDFLENGDVDFLLLDYKNEINLSNMLSRYDDGNRYFQDSKFKGGLLSNCIVNKNTWKELKMERYIGCLWIHFAYQMEALAPIRHGKAGYIKDRLFDSLPTLRTWGGNGSFLLTGIELLDVFSNMEKLGYNQETKKAAAMVIKGAYPKNIIHARAEGLHINDATYKRICRAYDILDPLECIDKFFLCCPKIVCDIIYFPNRIKKCIKNIIKRIIRWDKIKAKMTEI